ncbi:type II toxin-antitoxin system RelE/ParE family toxin [Taibaiella koreensis]|uniref:type II toxin-antitoxin system RelE/ParE family toxin n=1 Tax=Taibaiella koreensis TaxID=1268548 RepID=UPI000E59DD44|nr:type II toxin-antitoxin system RelE/ParE family toxin [Taibaiella koreensis]
MSFTILLAAKARQEFLKAWQWYEDRQPGLGDRFREEVYKQIAAISQFPERYPEQKKNYWEIGIPIFPLSHYL